MVREFRWIIAIDPGVTNGIAFWDGVKLVVDQCDIPRLFELIKESHDFERGRIFIILEDARKTRRPKTVTLQDSISKAQGAGWIRTLCGVIEKYLMDNDIPYKLVKPRARKRLPNGKLAKEIGPAEFKALTGIETLKGESHKRDAGVFAYQHPLKFFYKS